MASCVSSIVSQLHAASRTSDEETWTDASLQFAIALLPPDDNWKNLPVIQIEAERVPKGQEGALIRLRISRKKGTEKKPKMQNENNMANTERKEVVIK